MRNVYELTLLDRIQITGIESIAATDHGRHLFVGITDGSLLLYEIRQLNDEKGSYECELINVMRKASKERKPVLALKVVEDWFMLLGIMDGYICVYDLNTLKLVNQITETKGCTTYDIHEKENLLCIISSRRICIYSKYGPTFLCLRELQTAETPRSVLFSSFHIILGYRKHYEIIDFQFNNAMRILEIEKEHRVVTVELPATPSRSELIAMSLGTQAALLHLPSKGLGTNPSTLQQPIITTERIEWSNYPYTAATHSCHYPFLITLLANSIEIHDISSTILAPTQRLHFNAPITLTMCKSPLNLNSRPIIYVASSDALVILRMVPYATQITTLGHNGLYEEALAFLAVIPAYVKQNSSSSTSGSVKGKVTGGSGGSLIGLQEEEERQLRQRYAWMLLQRGDYEGYFSQHTLANTPPLEVLENFPDFLLPGTSYHNHMSTALGSGKLPSTMLSKVAALVVTFCEFWRTKLTGWPDSSSSSVGVSSVDSSKDEILHKEAVIVDSALLVGLLLCSPPRQFAIIELLSKRKPVCRSQMEGSVLLLASQGLGYTEALLWLYRSRGDHLKLQQLLTEEKCVNTGFWSREQFQSWTSGYLRSLWISGNPNYSAMVMTSLRPLLETNPELGMEVLVPSNSNNTNALYSSSTSSVTATSYSTKMTGSVTAKEIIQYGAGISVDDVVAFLLSISPAPRPAKPLIVPQRSGNPLPTYCLSIPLLSGRAMAVTYLEWLIGHGLATGLMDIHDLYAQMLLEGIPVESTTDHTANNLSIQSPTSPVPLPSVNSSTGNQTTTTTITTTSPGYDPVTYEDRSTTTPTPTTAPLLTTVTSMETLSSMLYKIYRAKLQAYLQSPISEYRPEKLLKFLPTQFLHEFALLMSKLGKHEDALRTYVLQLRNLSLAEEYSNRIYCYSLQIEKKKDSSFSEAQTAARGVYLTLLKVLLSSDPRSSLFGTIPILTIVLELAEKYHSYFDTTQFIDLLPPTTPLHELSRFLGVVRESNDSKKKNLMIIHQLLRVQEVRLRAEGVTTTTGAVM